MEKEGNMGRKMPEAKDKKLLLQLLLLNVEIDTERIICCWIGNEWEGQYQLQRKAEKLFESMQNG